MSHNTQMNFARANEAIRTLNSLGIDTATAEAPLERWTRLREAIKSYVKPSAAPLWEALADGDAKATTKAAQDYMLQSAIDTAAKAELHREGTFEANTLAAVKQAVIEAQDEARTVYNEAADTFTQAFREAGNRPDPAILITSDGGAKTWKTLISSAQTMNRAAAAFRLAAEFGHKVNDQRSGLDQQVPYATDLPTITAVEKAKHANPWLDQAAHAPHKEFSLLLLAGGTLHAGDLHEQAEEVERLIEGATASRRMPKLGDMMQADEKAMARAAKKALKAGGTK